MEKNEKIFWQFLKILKNSVCIFSFDVFSREFCVAEVENFELKLLEDLSGFSFTFILGGNPNHFRLSEGEAGSFFYSFSLGAATFGSHSGLAKMTAEQIKFFRQVCDELLEELE